jgi:hypothetical protein
MDKIIYEMLEKQTINEFNIFGQDIVQSTKDLLNSVEMSLKNKNIKKLKKLADKIPKKDIPTIWKMANNNFTDFKRNFEDAKRKLLSKKIMDEKNVTPVAMGTAVVASATRQDVDTILKDVAENMKDKKTLLFLIPGSSFALKSVIFILVLAWIYVTNGAAIVTILKGMSIMLLIFGRVLDGGLVLFEKAFMSSSGSTFEGVPSLDDVGSTMR